MWEGSGFQCVLRPPVVHPTALAWVPDREVLVVATRGGELLAVDLVLGVRAIADGLDETAALALHPDRERVLTLSRSRTWRVGTLGGDELVSGTHPFMRKMTGFFAGEHVVMLGDTASGHRVLHIFRVEGEGAERVTAMRLPKGVSATLGEHGELLLVRSTRAGLEVLSLRAIRRGARFRTGPETKHHLRGAGAWVLGFIPEGFCVWSREGGTPRSMRLADLTAGDVSRDGAVLGLGTRNGAIVLARTESIENRVRPDMVRAFDTPVTSAAFADRGRWLATGAEGLRIWSWADRPMSQRRTSRVRPGDSAIGRRLELVSVLKPSVQEPTALAWLPGREELLVTTRDGELIGVDPVLGTRPITSMIGVCPVLAVHPDGQRWLAVSEGGQWQVGTRDGEVLATGRHELRSNLVGFFTEDRVALLGGDAEGRRRLLVFEGGHRLVDIEVPHGVGAGPSGGNALRLTRATHAGLEHRSLQQAIAGDGFDASSAIPQTQHHLRLVGEHVLGVAPSGGVCVWDTSGAQIPRSLRLPSAVAADLHVQQGLLAMGTRHGVVALVDLERGDRAQLKVRAFDAPVACLAFASSGRWLAMGAEGLRIWSWETRGGGGDDLAGPAMPALV